MALDTYTAGFVMILASAVLAVVGLLGARRLLHGRDLLSCHDVGGYLISIVGTLYAVILGLIVVDSMGKFQQARLTTELESNSLANVLILANQLPRAHRDETQRRAQAYLKHVVGDEWPAMEQGRHSPETRRAAVRLIEAVSNFEPTTEKEKAIYAAQLESLCQFWDSRRTRTVAAANGVTPLEWVVLLAGGAITVAFTYFFKLEHLRVQVVMTVMVSVIIALNLYLVLMFGYPFSGDMKVRPDGFVAAEVVTEPPTAPPQVSAAP